MIEHALTLSHGTASASPGLIHDIVLVRRNSDGSEKFSFNFGEVAKDAHPVFTEIGLASEVGNTGQGIWKISGDLPLYQNDADTAGYLQNLVGSIYELHILYTDGRYVATDVIARGKWSDIPLRVLERFPNAAAFRSRFGVTISLVDTAENMGQLILKIDGATAIKATGTKSITDFYKLFAHLNDIGAVSRLTSSTQSSAIR